MKTIVILSGGLDSTTLLYHLKAEGHEVHTLTFNYGQRHRRELDAAKAICEATNTTNEIVDLSSLAPLFSANALTDAAVAVPRGEYAEENLAVTTVPNRNMIMLPVAIGRVISLGFDAVAFGAHGGVNGQMYADCSPAFAGAMNSAGRECASQPISVLAPSVTWTKAEIVLRGAELGVPFELTWSCYEGADVPCNRCATCLDRSSAFESSSVRDPIARSL